jgi:hypothetical protein
VCKTERKRASEREKKEKRNIFLLALESSCKPKNPYFKLFDIFLPKTKMFDFLLLKK